VRALLAAALVGVLHVHHVPSHDSDAPFEEVLAGAYEAGLDFLVLTEHADVPGPLPAAERAGLYERPDGGRLLVLVGVEVGTRDGHLVALDVTRVPEAEGEPGRAVIDRVHADGGFAVVSHPFEYGGWGDFDAPFDGIEVHNNAASWRRLRGPLLPFRLLRLRFAPEAFARDMLVRPARELELWDRLLAEGRWVVALSGADAHRNVSLFGWPADPYGRVFSLVQTVCPDAPLTPEAVWGLLRGGHCSIRYRLFEDRAGEAEQVRFPPSGREELQLDGGERVLEIRQAPRPGL
jgi:hypothetical protein